MNLLQLKAYLPGKGEVNLLYSPNLADTKQLLEGDNDAYKNNAFTIGSAIMLPYANRIRGTLADDGKTIQTTVAGHGVSLPANWQGKHPGSEKHAMHGLLLSSQFVVVEQDNQPEESHISALFSAGDFGGHWPSSTDVNVQAALKDTTLDILIQATNVGVESLPIGIGAHPYFVFPSGNRQQATLHLPAAKYAPVNNYDDVFPTGELASVTDTPLDFTAHGGRPLFDLYLDNSFTQLQRDTDGNATVTIRDPATHYGLRVVAASPTIEVIQVYAPPDKAFIAIEPQFNLANPYGAEWGETDTGMVILQPGESTLWHMRLELFKPLL